jgi:hypothetical protein
MSDPVHKQPIDRLSAADSVLSLLADLRPENIPREERLAVANTQIEATEQWLSAYMEFEAARPALAVPNGRLSAIPER